MKGAQLAFIWGRAQGVGGTETRMAEVAARLEMRGVRVTSLMLGSDPSSPLAKLLAKDCSSVVHVGSWPTLVQVLRAAHPSAALAMGLRASLSARAARPLLGEIRLVDVRNGLEFGRGRAVWTIDRLTQRAVDTFLVNSDALGNELVARGKSKNSVHVLYSVLGDEWTTQSPVTHLNISHIIMVGNSRPEKNQLFGLNAVARLDGPVRLTVYTDNASSLRLAWDRIPRSPEISIAFVEGHTMVPADYASASVLLHPSLAESAPRVVIEARSQGLRVVASDVGDTRRLIGTDGCVVPVGDFEATVSALRRTLSRGGATSPSPSPARSLEDYCGDLLRVCGVVA